MGSRVCMPPMDGCIAFLALSGGGADEDCNYTVPMHTMRKQSCTSVGQGLQGCAEGALQAIPICNPHRAGRSRMYVSNSSGPNHKHNAMLPPPPRGTPKPLSHVRSWSAGGSGP